ncbi:MAG: Uxx-star family glutaredoxin-like (seleno)protein [Syntrophothermus sp.]
MAFAKVQIYGKKDCPYTQAAMEYYATHDFGIEYFDVERDEEAYNHMLELSGGRAEVPVILENERVTVGFNDGTSGV